jgi:predicted nuclease with TOPRIM domain
MTENQEKEVMRMLTKAVTGIQNLDGRLENVENKLEKVENRLEKVETEVKVMSKKLSHSIDGVAELRARVEILEEKMLSVN